MQERPISVKQAKQKKWPIIIAVILLGLMMLVFGVLALRILTPEDTWLCENGKWIKHGVPSAPMPTKSCLERTGGGQSEQAKASNSSVYSSIDLSGINGFSQILKPFLNVTYTVGTQVCKLTKTPEQFKKGDCDAIRDQIQSYVDSSLTN
jgi:hypothetical protein